MYGLYLIPLLLIGLTPLAFGEIEKGINFDRELISINPDGTQVFQWTSTPDRLLIDGEFVEYQFTETNDLVRYESEQITFEFYKSSCDFKLYETGLINDTPVIESYSTTISVNDNIINFPVCLVQNIIESEDGVTFEVRRGAATILFELGNGVEWTYDVVGNGVIKITEVCTNCQGDQIDDQRIQFGDYILDTKNNIHGAFDEATQQGNDYWIKYESISNGRIIIDPSFNEATSEDRAIIEKDNDGVCEDTGGTYLIDTGAIVYSYIYETSSINDCIKFYVEFDTSTIPDAANVQDTDLVLEVNSVPSTEDHDIYGMIATQPSTIGVAATLFAAINDGTKYIDDYTISSTGSKTIDLGGSADSELETSLVAAIDWFAVSMEVDSAVTQEATSQGAWFDSDSGATPARLQVTYTLIPDPDAVDDLTSTDIGFDTVDLDWTEPDLNTGNLTGYQVKYGTPWTDNPSTIITNNTESSDTDAEVTGLSELTDYSFRIGVWTEGFNGTGNVLNVTTLEDFVSSNFTPGFFDLNATNVNVIQMYFERTDTNSTSVTLKVIYPTAYDLSCDFSYKFANTNQTYSSLTETPTTHSGIDSAVESEFQFHNVDSEIINVYCWDQNNLSNDGSYIITQVMFPLLQQIADFRAGEFGTSGGFGALDLITMFVIIISMIGFNRVNESVGAIFNIIFLGALAYFEIIEIPTIIFGMIAVVIMVVIGTTRKK